MGLFFSLAGRVYKDDRIPSDAIVVLGARAYIDGKYNPCLKARVDHASELYEKKLAPLIIMSGGYDREDRENEAETMKKIAMENGINESDIILEKDSASTYENLKYSKEILKKNNMNSVILVTEPFHSPRASMIADKLNISFSVSPAKDSECWTRGKYLSRYFLKEPFAVLLYKLQGKI
ncbi:protein containing DUF218 [sediment metagenome]|uniref:Protein containing DUF218 n=1 Tax=sediment metagenome TaxID=749907 RepID=D9PKS6_9ZZZZ